MHGTYRWESIPGSHPEVRFIVPRAMAARETRQGAWRLGRFTVLFLLGCGLAALARDTGTRPRPAKQPESSIDQPQFAGLSIPAMVAPELRRFAPQVRIVFPLPQPEPATAQAQASPAIPPVLAVQTLPLPIVPIEPPPLPPLPARAPEQVALRPVDIEQITDMASRSIAIAQLDAPEADAGQTLLADKVDAMQVPPLRLDPERLAEMRVGAPEQLTLRIGESTAGKVAFRMSETRSIDIQLGTLLEVLADRFPADEFQRLRGSAAADGYVSIDTLRSIGLSLRYDPVYDELRLSA